MILYSYKIKQHRYSKIHETDETSLSLKNRFLGPAVKPFSIANDAPPLAKDKNGDGTVSSTELKEVLQHVNPKFTEEVGWRAGKQRESVKKHVGLSNYCVFKVLVRRKVRHGRIIPPNHTCESYPESYPRIIDVMIQSNGHIIIALQLMEMTG